MLATSGGAPDGGASTTSDAPASSPAPTSVTVADVLDRAETNPDGSVTVSLDDDETAGLVASALTRAPRQPLRDVGVDLLPPEGDADGRLLVTGRLEQPSVPVEAVVDLRVVDRTVRPTVQDVSIGPVPVPAGVREDIDRQVRELALVADDQLAVEELTTTQDTLVLTGRPR